MGRRAKDFALRTGIALGPAGQRSKEKGARMRLLILLFLVLISAVGYLSQLNPGRILFFVAPDRPYEISLAALILFSITAGGLLVIVASGMRQTKALYQNWTYRRAQKKEASLEKIYKEGGNAFLAKRHKDAVSLFQKVLEINPNHLNTLIRLGKIYRSEKNFSESIRFYRKARLADDQNMEVLLGLAQSLDAANQSEEALSILKETIQMDATNLTAWIRIREIYMRLSRWEAAASSEEKILKLSLPNEQRQKEQTLFLGIQFEKGMVALKDNQLDAARKSFKSAIKMSKDFLPAYIGLARTYIQAGRGESAMTLFEKGYSMTGSLILLHQLEDLCFDLSQPDRIIHAYRNALEKEPGNIALRFYLGKLYYRLEMVDEAYEMLSEMGEQVEYFPDLHKILGNLYLRRGDTLLAAQSFQKGLQSKNPIVVPYYCPLCDYHTATWSGRCGRCHEWNSYQAIPLMIAKSPNGGGAFVAPAGHAAPAGHTAPAAGVPVVGRGKETVYTK
jgi:tetratricopeptide (TPR) repeat protein